MDAGPVSSEPNAKAYIRVRVSSRLIAPCGQFIYRHTANSLAQIHRWLARISGNLDEHVAESKIFASSRASPARRPAPRAAASELVANSGVSSGSGITGCSGLRCSSVPVPITSVHSATAASMRSLALRFAAGPRRDGGLGFAPVFLVGSDHKEMRKAEVAMARAAAPILRDCARDEHDLNALALEFGEQEMILVQNCVPSKCAAVPPQERPIIFGAQLHLEAGNSKRMF